MVSGVVVTAITLAGAAGIAADAPGASAAQSVSADLSYRYQFPAGAQPGSAFPASVTVVASFPAYGAGRPAGRADRPAPDRAVVSLGDRHLTSLGATSVSGSGTLASAQASTAKAARRPDAGPVATAPEPGPSPAASPCRAGRDRLTGPERRSAATGRRPGPPGRRSPLVPWPSTCRWPGPPPARPPSTMVQLELRSRPGPPVPSSPRSSCARPGKRTGQKKIKFPPATARSRSSATAPRPALLTGYTNVAKLIGAALLQPAAAEPGLVNVDFAERLNSRTAS